MSAYDPAGGEWIAVASDADGFVLDEDTLTAWAEAVQAGKRGWAIPCEQPTEIAIVRGSARPVPQSSDPDEQHYRRPASWLSGDIFLARWSTSTSSTPARSSSSGSARRPPRPA